MPPARLNKPWSELLGATLPLSHVVGTDYVVERLACELIERNPAALDWLNRQRGKGSIRLANALMDWRDMWGAKAGLAAFKGSLCPRCGAGCRC